MAGKLVSSVVILGGGTAGWMTAAALSRSLNNAVKITVVESDEIGTVGVGEATIPLILRFHEFLGLDENEFIRETQATFKLGIEFRDWARIGDRYMHGFGRLRNDIRLGSFEQVWERAARAGSAADLQQYSVTKMAAYAGKFVRPRSDLPDSPLADIAYAFHFDANLYAKYLRKFSERAGVNRVEGKVVNVSRHAETDRITSLTLANGTELLGEFFVDCSGFRGRLIEEEFHTGYEDWSHWLPCNRAVAVPCFSAGPLLPYTRAIARPAGWQWRIPLQHRIGNGYVYSSDFISEDEASSTLLNNLDGPPLAEPRALRFVPGRRKRAWQANCVAIGLSSGFLEPLESTSIHLIQTAIGRLLKFFPTTHPSVPDIEEYNRLTQKEIEHVRDFVILHYHATARDDSPFWNYCRTMEIPQSLRRKLDLFRSQGRVAVEPDELFAETGWVQVAHGQGLRPSDYQRILDVIDIRDVSAYLEELRASIKACVGTMPTHEEFIYQHCKAPSLSS